MTYDGALLTPNEVADLLRDRLGVGVSARTVRGAVRDHGLAHTRVGSPPRPGARDQRRVMFTADQADHLVDHLVAAWAQHVPAATATA